MKTSGLQPAAIAANVHSLAKRLPAATQRRGRRTEKFDSNCIDFFFCFHLSTIVQLHFSSTHKFDGRRKWKSKKTKTSLILLRGLDFLSLSRVDLRLQTTSGRANVSCNRSFKAQNSGSLPNFLQFGPNAADRPCKRKSERPKEGGRPTGHSRLLVLGGDHEKQARVDVSLDPRVCDQ